MLFKNTFLFEFYIILRHNKFHCDMLVGADSKGIFFSDDLVYVVLILLYYLL